MGRGKRTATQARQRLTPLTVEPSSSRVAPPVSLVVESPSPPPAAEPLPPSSRNPAASSRQRKQSKPELYCPDKRCLWMTGGGYCPNHGGPAWTKEREGLARKRSRGDATAEEIALLETLAGLRP
jgi:hypothetical protein